MRRALPEQPLVVLAQPTGLAYGLTPADIEFRGLLVRRRGIPGLGRFARSLPREPVDLAVDRATAHTVDPAVACATARAVAHAS